MDFWIFVGRLRGLGVLLDEYPGMLSVLLEAIRIFWGFHKSLSYEIYSTPPSSSQGLNMYIPLSTTTCPIMCFSSGIPVYIPCTGSLPNNGVVSVVVGVGTYTCSFVQILNSLISLFTLKYFFTCSKCKKGVK